MLFRREKYVNLIRERAGIPRYGAGINSIPVPVSQEDMRAAIRRERRVELNNEGIRYRDIRRWKIGEKELDGNFYGMNFSGTEKDDNESNPKAFFKRSVYQKRVFTAKNYWFPIPQGEIDKNPNLVQNPFWD
ncbi:RagB/SusD family nutrient uptake outer membrane protein [Sphingobacterium sp. UT-1RO-CII-1]|uniref:RagB/SusD family nutrient uptake outer membrane protein n=1 Tax=Sphingobacterium sp. UT-1RO-CII-1 TaxID=2995225 RepID=UPI00227BBB45|nr:RagB/SusD family nutrient uptake outer membrane protein [Sphingobacterium sp. UT-1RO-CII-1]MCY4780379.1 RagB/SusD family nutrient uptake outer membrane protein [Sphingobacterium sp. UT-1RO-CII-1]